LNTTAGLKDQGFTLIELLVVVVIVGILAALALPQFGRTLEIAKGRESEASLSIIFRAERAYYLDNDRYGDQADFGAAGDLVPDFVSLGGIDSSDWTFAVASGGTGGSTFVGTATRQGGGFSGQTRTINQDGTLNPTTWPP